MWFYFYFKDSSQFSNKRNIKILINNRQFIGVKDKSKKTENNNKILYRIKEMIKNILWYINFQTEWFCCY